MSFDFDFDFDRNINRRSNDDLLLDFYIRLHNETSQRIDLLYQTQREIRESIHTIHRQNNNRRRNRSNNNHTNNHTNNNNQRRNGSPHINYYLSQDSSFRNQPFFMRQHVVSPSALRFNGAPNTNTNTVNGNSLFTNILDSFYDNVRVAPTEIQIQNATRRASFSQVQNPINSSCPISLERFQDDTEVIEILHCHHCFQPDSFNLWFSNNVRCPVCRYDIRTSPPPVDASHNEISTPSGRESERISNSNTIERMFSQILENSSTAASAYSYDPSHTQYYPH